MSTGRWEHLTQTSPMIRFGSWLFTQLNAMPYPGLSLHSLAFEFDPLEAGFLPQ